MFVPCVYGRKEQRRLVADVMPRGMQVMRDWVAARRAMGHAPDHAAYRRSWVGDFSRMGPMFKHRSFHEEREWRIVLAHGFDAEKHTVEFRPGSSMPTPYLPRSRSR
jgi:hypothetical protein